MALFYCAICGPGLVRAENQDNLYINGVYRGNISDNAVFRYEDVSVDGGLFAVADGMGGEKRGDLAALEAVRNMGDIDPADGRRGMVRHIDECNAVICEHMKANGARIGSTFVGLCIAGGRADIVNVGDSRLYMFRGGELAQLSRDHTSVRQMLELGAITEEAARRHPDRHDLTQHLGIFPAEMVIEPHTAYAEVEAGDIFLLCSDGLTDMLEDACIKKLLETDGSVCEKAEALYDIAIMNGGRDNITVLLVQADKGD